MPAVPLPLDPDLEQLRKQAKQLRDHAAAGVPGALELIAEFHPRGAHQVSLTGAKLVLARRHGFANWADLRRHVDVVREYRRAPDEVERGDGLAAEFLALACLRYGDDDGPQRWAAARSLLAGHPDLPRRDIHVAAAVCDAESTRLLLERDPGLASREGGPYRWQPLCYLAYARHDPAVPEDAALATARLLLDQGADPNTGYLWHGLPSPFTVLTGLFGAGELGVDRRPGHPHAIALASLLLRAGADPNDSQTLYNRQFGEDDRHLELLLAHGLGRGDGGPWRARLGDAVDAPAELVRRLLWWAIVHDQRKRVRLLAAHGTDVTKPFRGWRWLDSFEGRTPCEVAELNGNRFIVEELVQRGAPPPALRGADALLAAVLAGEAATAGRLRTHAAEVRARRPGLMVWAAGSGKSGVIPLLAELGFDVNALGRGDAPIEQPWETALHQAASHGDTELARLLLSLGGDPNLRDARFGATPLGWARHFGQTPLVTLLTPLTRET